MSGRGRAQVLALLHHPLEDAQLGQGGVDHQHCVGGDAGVDQAPLTEVEERVHHLETDVKHGGLEAVETLHYVKVRVLTRSDC